MNNNIDVKTDLVDMHAFNCMLKNSSFTLTLHDTRCVHDSVNRGVINLLLILIFYVISQVTIFNFPLTRLIFRIF